ncbi:unnamed protein product [Camellia sinensis]
MSGMGAGNGPQSEDQKPNMLISLNQTNSISRSRTREGNEECALNILLQRAMDLRLIKGVSIGANDEVHLTHLQFADDSLLFCDADLSEVLNLKRILRCFEVASGLKINYHKSVLCGIGISGSALPEFAGLLNCKTQNLPIKYLGLPLGANPKRKNTWKPVVDKVKLRLAGWKMKLLSFAGRLTLVKAVLSSIPVYYLSLFKLPEGIAKELDKIQASFLWGGPDLKRKIHLVKWSEVTKSIKQGGLGVRRIRDVNLCLLLKWWWRFVTEPESLWYRVLCSKYQFPGGKWFPNPSLNTSSSYIWNGIETAGEHNQSLSLFFANNLQLKVGNGCRIRFWSDSWCGNVCLKEEFPRLFSLSSQQEGLLKEFVEVSAISKNWLFTFRRPLFVWEKNELLRLYGIIGSVPSFQAESQDSAIWRASKPGQSFVSNLYNHTCSVYGGTDWFYHLVWIKYLPPKVQFFGWLAWKHKIKTSVFLQQIGVLDSSASTLCVFCKAHQESIEHVLIHCPSVWKVWSGLLQWWGHSCKKAEQRIWENLGFKTVITQQ